MRISAKHTSPNYQAMSEVDFRQSTSDNVNDTETNNATNQVAPSPQKCILRSSIGRPFAASRIDW